MEHRLTKKEKAVASNPQAINELAEQIKAIDKTAKKLYMCGEPNPDKALLTDELKAAFANLWDAAMDYATTFEVFSHE